MITRTSAAVAAVLNTDNTTTHNARVVPTARNRGYRAARVLVRGTIESLISRRRATAEADWPDDLLSRLMHARDEETGQAMSEGLLRDESITTFFAGHETTARTMTFAWYALAANPTVTQRLHEELDRVLAGRAPTTELLRQLPYTLQVIKEVLRLYPAAPFYVRDAIAGDQIGGFEVPAGAAALPMPVAAVSKMSVVKVLFDRLSVPSSVAPVRVVPFILNLKPLVLLLYHIAPSAGLPASVLPPANFKDG